MDHRIVEKNLKTRKIERKRINQLQLRAHQKLFDFVLQQRTKNIHFADCSDPSYAYPEESIREFMDALRIILQSGYFVEQQDFFELVSILKV